MVMSQSKGKTVPSYSQTWPDTPQSDAGVEKAKVPESLTLQLGLVLAICAAEGADGAILGSTFKALERELGVGPSILATMSLVQGLAGKVASPVWGWMCDDGIAARRTLFMIGCIGWGVAVLLLGLASSSWQIVALRMLNGVFLACGTPLAQSWVSDSVNTKERGTVFGLFAFSSNIGGMVIGSLTTSVSQIVFFGYYGWRMVCVAVGIASMFLAFLLWLFMTETAKPRMRSLSLLEVLARVFRDVGENLSIPTLSLLIFQGVAGSIPWTALVFETMYLQYLGFTDLQVGLMMFFWGPFAATGSLLGGVIGDMLAKWSSIHGRPLLAQFSVALGIPLLCLYIAGLPKLVGVTSIVPYIIAKGVFLLTATWTGAGTNRPLLVQLVAPHCRASIVAWEYTFEQGMASMIAMPVVSFLSEQTFGYRVTDLAVQDMPQDLRMTNMYALQQSILICAVVPWLLCFVGYTLMHFTYPKDQARVAKSTADEELDDQRALLFSGQA